MHPWNTEVQGSQDNYLMAIAYHSANFRNAVQSSDQYSLTGQILFHVGVWLEVRGGLVTPQSNGEPGNNIYEVHDIKCRH